MSSNARKTVPAGVLAHPAITALIAQAQPSGSVTPEDVRRATEDAAVEGRDLKALMTHLAGLGISVALPAGARVAAATTTKKTTTAKAAKAAPAKKAAAAKAAPAKKAAAKTAAKAAPAAKTAEPATDGAATPEAAVVIGPDG